MSDYIPTTDHIRALLIPAQRGDLFDRWLEAHDREVAAKALRDAADTLDHWQSAEAHIGDPVCEGPNGASAAYALFEEAIEDPEDWLRGRADQIEAGGSDG